MSPIIRKNITHLFIYRLRNYGDLEPIIEEMGAIYGKKTLLQMCHEAVSEPYSFLYINLVMKDKKRCVCKASPNIYFQVNSYSHIYIYIYI